jgi:hypothetical protein
VGVHHMSTVVSYSDDVGSSRMSILGNRVSQKGPWLLIGVLVLCTVGALSLWLHDHAALQEARTQIVTRELQPIATLFKENRTLLQELKSEPFTEADSGILESYLAKIRRDGVAKHADSKQRLDQLAENNTAIVTLIKGYAPHAKTPAFTSEADKFRNYASAWRDRWNSVMEIFMAGGNYPASGVSFPAGIFAAVEAEIAAAR